MFGIRRTILNSLSRKYHLARLPQGLKRPLTLTQIRAERPTRNEMYFHCVYYFDHFLPDELREHRQYFTKDQRGFGEDAFHSMWFLLFQEFRPASALEIGVYRGQTVSLWKLLSRRLGYECRVGCVSPFASAGDSVSQYQQRPDYFEDTVRNHRHFSLEMPECCRHFSTDPEAQAFIGSRLWDLIYIDGNHDYEVARRDWKVCASALAPQGLIVLDDSSLTTDYVPPRFATAGHPGPSRLAQEIDGSVFREIFSAGHNRVFQKAIT
jgi:hypothetical protein